VRERLLEASGRMLASTSRGRVPGGYRVAQTNRSRTPSGIVFFFGRFLMTGGETSSRGLTGFRSPGGAGFFRQIIERRRLQIVRRDREGFERLGVDDERLTR
jgi:hypothetical protein